MSRNEEAIQYFENKIAELKTKEKYTQDEAYQLRAYDAALKALQNTPPCEVGSTVHAPDKSWTGEVTEICLNADGWWLYVHSGGYNTYYCANNVTVE